MIEHTLTCDTHARYHHLPGYHDLGEPLAHPTICDCWYHPKAKDVKKDGK